MRRISLIILYLTMAIFLLAGCASGAGSSVGDEAENVVYNLSVTVAGGIVYVTLPEERAITVYDMVGRKVCVIDGMEGVNEISYLPQGMYMIEKTKVYVKR